MANGLPVISTNHAGIPYVIRHGHTGLLADERNIDELVEYILELAHNFDKRLQLAQQGQQYVVANLDVRRKERDLEAIYQRVIHQKEVRQAVKREIVQ
jgi:glycosyltransferase involved in cell wall biosynthesis